MNLATEKLKIL